MLNADQIRADALAKAEKQIHEGEIKAQIVTALPVTPRSVHVHTLYKSVASASYEVESRADALAVYQAFNVSPSYICRGNFVSVKCYDDETAREVSEVHATVVCDQFGAKLSFFTQTPVGMVRVDIGMPLQWFGQYIKDNERAVSNYKLEWRPLAKTGSMFLAIRYAAAEPIGPHSAGQRVYALYDTDEVINQFSEGV